MLNGLRREVGTCAGGSGAGGLAGGKLKRLASGIEPRTWRLDMLDMLNGRTERNKFVPGSYECMYNAW